MDEAGKVEEDPEREKRIGLEIIADAYDAEEQSMGWYYYLEERLHFPFTATCRAKRAISPVQIGDEVEVIGMPGEDECRHEMFVTIRWERDGLAVPLAQLRATEGDEETRQAVEDWCYWVARGYEL